MFFINKRLGAIRAAKKLIWCILMKYLSDYYSFTFFDFVFYLWHLRPCPPKETAPWLELSSGHLSEPRAAAQSLQQPAHRKTCWSGSGERPPWRKDQTHKKAVEQGGNVAIFILQKLVINMKHLKMWSTYSKLLWRYNGDSHGWNSFDLLFHQSWHCHIRKTSCKQFQRQYCRLISCWF